MASIGTPLKSLCAAFLLYIATKVLWKWILYPKYFSPLRLLPQAPGGSYLMGQFSNQFRGNPGALMRKWANEVPNHGLIRYLDILNLERVLVVKPKALADILVHNNYDFEKPGPLRRGISRILGMGLFLAEGEQHKQQRKNLMPAFSFRHVKDLYPVFWTKSIETVENVWRECKGADTTTVEVNRWATRSTLDIIGLAGMGHDFNAVSQPDNDLLKTYRALFRLNRTGRILALAGIFLPTWIVRALPIRRNNDINQATPVIRAHCKSLIENKRLRMQDEKVPKDGKLDILDVAFQSGAFTDEELVNQLMTFLVAGHETTASAMTWVIYLLCKHPDTQSRLREEIISSMPDRSRSPHSVRSIDVDGLRYLSAVINETLRLFPPVSVTVRVCVKDTIIAGQRIPEGTAITLSPWAINASYELWGDDAHEFRPDRWLEGSATGASTSNFSFMTFLHGPRSCIGEKFARAELACLVAAWVITFDTRLADMNYVPDIQGGITAKPKDGLLVKIKSLE